MDLKQKTEKKLNILAGDHYQSKKYIIGVSGGKDSICLLYLMRSLLPNKQINVVHINYKLRGWDSEKDERFVRKTCESLSVECFVHHPKVLNKSELHLRDLRLTYFKKLLKETRFDYLVLAHHAQDQLETVLMRIIRGTGMVGLGGIKEKNGRILRPLLTISPSEISNYLQNFTLKYRTDKSNNSKLYFRNHIRHELIPLFEKLAIQHGGAESLYEKVSALTTQLQKTNSYLSEKNSHKFKSLISENVFWYRLAQEKFMKLSILEQEWLIHSLLVKLKAIPSRATISRVISAISSGKDLSMTEGIGLSISCGQVFFQTSRQKRLLARVKGPLNLGLNMNIPKGMELRFPLPGDRMGSSKLKKKLLQERIPKLMRKVLPVLAHRGTSNVVWYLKTT